MNGRGLEPFIDLAEAGPTRATIELVAPPRREPPPVEGLLAGAAEVDITPPPGMPKAGHSRNARDGSGFRTRLKARVLHLRSGRASVALVAGDMHAGSALVHRLVAQAVSGETDVPLAGLFLGATHTHAGPGQFHGCDFYNQWASNRPGLDPAYTDFLARRIAEAVTHACRTRRPARLAVGSTQVWGYTRNRSLDAHVRNATVADKRTAAQRKYSAVNPWLHLLRVDGRDPSGGYVPLAAFAVFSIHGTGISRHDPAYNADVWAYITGEMGHGIERRTGTRPVAAAVEGTHGDVTPAVREGMLVYPEAERIGRGIGAAAVDLHERLEPALTDEVRVAAGYREIDLDRAPRLGGVRLPHPAVGAAKLAGAAENTTPLLDRIPPFRAGFPKPGGLSGGGHGAKWVLGGVGGQRLVAPASAFPRVLPVQLLLLGSMALLALPFEVTVEAGNRLARAVTEALGSAAGVDQAVVSSAANDYWDYLTTPEEYGRQAYEGASTLYGPASLAFVAAAATALATELRSSGGVEDVVERRRFDSRIRRFVPRSEPAGSGPPRDLCGGARLVEATPLEDAFWEIRWRGGGRGTIRWDQPVARVEAEVRPGVWAPARDGDGRVVDDQGWHVGVTDCGPDGSQPGARRYAARWYQPPLGAPVRHRFVLEANHGHPELAGPAFD